MTTDHFNSSEFTHAVLLPGSVEQLMPFFNTVDGLCTWFIGDAVFKQAQGFRSDDEACQPGDEYYWKWLAKDYELQGKVIHASNDQVVFTFGVGAQVAIMLRPAGKNTRVELRQFNTDFTDEFTFSHINCCVCWTFFLTNLKSIACHGHDLREVYCDDEILINR